MELDPLGYYRMPLIMGPLGKGEKPRIPYPQTESVAFQYLTDIDALSSLLPSCYKPGKEPLVTVFFGYNNGLDFMAGGGYSIAAVQVSALFDGIQDHVEGDYILVMFENDTWPILGGREDLGVPKLYADISSIKVVSGNTLRCEASLWGHLLFGVEILNLKKQNLVTRLGANKIINSRPWLAYKYIPSLDGPPDADYPTITKNDTNIKELWLSNSGNLFFGNAEYNDVGYVKSLIDSLKKLPVIKIKQAIHFKGSATLRYDLSRRLK